MASKTSDWRPGPTVCRCCLTEGCYKDISTEYFWMGKREVYAEMLSETMNVTIAYSKSGGPNSNSRLICEPCISRLRDASDFKRQVVECEKTFMNHLDPGNSSTLKDDVIHLESVEEVKIEHVKQEKQHSDDDDDDYEEPRVDFVMENDDDDDDLDDEPLMKLASKVPKKELDLQDLLDNSQLTVKRKSSTKSKEPAPKKAKKIVIKPSASKASASAPKTEKKKKGSDRMPENPQSSKQVIVPLFQVAYDRTLCKPLGTISDFTKLRKKRNRTYSDTTDTVPYNISRSPSPDEPEQSLTPLKIEDINPPPEFLLKSQPKKKVADTRQNALTLFEFSTAYPFVFSNNKFKCFICAQPFLDLGLLKQHMTEHTFSPLKRLVHNRKENVLKVDISDLTCKLCSLPIKDLVILKRHLKETHAKLVDLELQDNLIPFNLSLTTEGYQCVVCEQNFIKLRILVIHMSAHFSNYSCEICGSGFMTLRLLKKHLEVHETGNYPCDRCEKSFMTSYKRALHVRGVHLKLYPRRCPMCPERFNSNYKRTIHLQDVHNQSTRVHKCKTCGRGFNLKYHLICHVKSVHLQERNQQCDVCHQRFCNKESLKRHMVIHTGEKNHKCEVCGMAFLRRKNLKDHLRLHDIN